MFDCLYLVANSSEIHMTFSVEAIQCDFGFTELHRLLSVLQTGNTSRAKFRDLFISELGFALTSSKTKILVFFGGNHRFSGVGFTGEKGNNFVIPGDEKDWEVSPKALDLC
jgi:hypothetical protein